ncbi:MAG: hypothetical protein LBN27_09020 [Prevotellaceae bacterium]|jgi:hypothetical protein|nr:hypothetical protein [Prevotellaceae bacterium]
MKNFIILIPVILVCVAIWATIKQNKKNKERQKEYQPVLDKMFKERGFGATDIIGTDCKQILNSGWGDDAQVHNIVLSVKNGVVSFFGGGGPPIDGLRATLHTNTTDKKIVFKDTVHKPDWEKLLLKGNFDFYIDGSVDTLFPEKNNKIWFRHLFDIPIENIVEVSGKQIGKNVEVDIECTDRLIKLSSYCKNEAFKIDTINIILDAFGRIVNEGTLSQVKISSINNDIVDIIKEDAKLTVKKQYKVAGAIAGAVVAVGVGAAVSGSRNWSREQTISSIR